MNRKKIREWYRQETGREPDSLNAYTFWLEAQFVRYEKDSDIIIDAISDVDGFANFYLLKQGIPQEKIDEYIKKGIDVIEEIIKSKK